MEGKERQRQTEELKKYFRENARSCSEQRKSEDSAQEEMQEATDQKTSDKDEKNAMPEEKENLQSGRKQEINGSEMKSRKKSGDEKDPQASQKERTGGCKETKNVKTSGERKRQEMYREKGEMESSACRREKAAGKKKPEDPDPYLVWLAGILSLNAEKKIQLIKEYSPEEIFHMPALKRRQLCEYLQIRPEILEDACGQDPEAEAVKLKEKGISLTFFMDTSYPRRLRQIPDPPFALYYKGNLPPDSVSAAVIGARQCSEYGRETAKKVGMLLAECGVSVVSGMAYGIDSAGHAGALAGGGRTYAVLGCGADICYPAAERKLYEQILETCGGILSEYPPGTPPLSRNFPARNRIISGLSDFVIVAEAKKRSGSLITADFAMEQGKDVYAVPGRICDELSSGTNHLIAQGAGILCDPEQFLKDLNLRRENNEKAEKAPEPKLTDEESRLYGCLDFEPGFLDTIIEKAGFSVRETLRILDSLRRKGLVKEYYRNYFGKTYR